MRLLHPAALSLLLSVIPLFAQQVKFIDLTATDQRVELRYPPALPAQNGVGGDYSSISVGDCAPDFRDPRSLTVYVQSVIASDGNPKKPFEAEFKVLNTGKVPLELPVSPHLSDLQPNDASAPFTYMSLALAIFPVEDLSSIGFVELYGKADAPDTMITLKPGEWLKVVAKVNFSLKPPPVGSINLEPGYWLRRVTFYPRPGGSSRAMENVCPNSERAPAVPAHRN
jgi:hypothetical protein